MSVKAKLILGFIIIFVMVSIQSGVIVRTNQKQQELSAKASKFYEINAKVRDILVDAKNIEINLASVIEMDLPVPLEGDSNPRSAGALIVTLNSWYEKFVVSEEFLSIDSADARKQGVLDMKPLIEKIRSSMNKMRKYNDKKNRRQILYADINPAVQDLQRVVELFSQLSYWIYVSAERKMIEYTDNVKWLQIGIISFGLLLILFVIFYSKHVLKPIDWLMEGVKNIRQGNMQFQVAVKTKDELGELATQFNKMTVEIEQHRTHLEDMVNERTKQLEKSKQDLEQTNVNLKQTNTELTDARRIMDLDMKMAINVQKSFFLNRAPESKEWDIDFIFKPMSGVSGDMYDIYTDENGRITGLSLMDVSGHGIAAGLVTMIAKTISARIFNTSYRTKKLRGIMDEINDELIRHLGNVDNFLTGIMLKFDYKNQQVEYVNAGHTDLLFKPNGNNKFVVVAPPDNKQMYKGFFLGIEAMRASFSMLTFKIKKGDTLLIYSDCLNESVDDNDEEFGVERIKNILEDADGDVSAKEITHRAYDKLIQHTGTDSLNDDLAIIAIKKL